MNNLSNNNIIHIKNNKLEYIQFKKLLEYNDIIRHAITLKPFDIGSNESFYNKTEEVKKDYKKLCDILEINNKNIYRPFQTHTDIVKCVNDENPGIFTEEFKNVDALTTNRKNKILSVSIADCIDLIFFDPVKKVIANTHSGWQGTYKLISQKTVENMVDNYDCNPKDIICCIGPSIRKCHFEVDEDIKERFFEKFKHLYNINEIIGKGRIEQNKQKFNIDTVLINTTILKQMGLKEENIIDCGICTVCNSDKFHSYRVDREISGRNTGIITLV